MRKRILNTDNSAAPLILRMALGIMIVPHGAQKLLGWFGGTGLQGTLQGMQEAFGLSPAVTVLVIGVEFAGGLALIFGALTRIMALAVGVEMAVAALVAHVGNGFFMNWYGNQAGEGFEFHILAVGIAAALVMLGGGAASLDRMWRAAERRRRPEPTPIREAARPQRPRPVPVSAGRS